MSQKSQGNSQSKKEGADRGKPGNTKSVAGIERVKSGSSFGIPDHPEHCNVRGPGGKMDK